MSLNRPVSALFAEIWDWSRIRVEESRCKGQNDLGALEEATMNQVG